MQTDIRTAVTGAGRIIKIRNVTVKKFYRKSKHAFHISITFSPKIEPFMRQCGKKWKGRSQVTIKYRAENVPQYKNTLIIVNT